MFMHHFLGLLSQLQEKESYIARMNRKLAKKKQEASCQVTLNQLVTASE